LYNYLLFALYFEQITNYATACESSLAYS